MNVIPPIQPIRTAAGDSMGQPAANTDKRQQSTPSGESGQASQATPKASAQATAGASSSSGSSTESPAVKLLEDTIKRLEAQLAQLQSQISRDPDSPASAALRGEMVSIQAALQQAMSALSQLMLGSKDSGSSGNNVDVHV